MSNYDFCCWVVRPATRETPAEYCEKPTNWTIALDEDRRRVKQYEPFCPEHMERARALEELGENEE